MTRALAIAIAGCGPCGLAAALLLARDGHRVTLFERFAAPRPVGSGLMLQPTGLAVLRAMGLDGAALAAGARIDRLFGQAAASGRTVLDVRYPKARFGIGIHRASLFALLHDAVRAEGIAVETDRTVSASEDGGSGRSLSFADGSRAGPFDLVVDALGTRSPLAALPVRDLAYGALWTNVALPAHGFDGAALEQRYHRASVMAGVLPVGTPPGAGGPCAALFWSLRTDRLEAWRAAGLDAWKAGITALWPATVPLVAQIDDAGALTFARYAHRTHPRPAASRLIHLGDAWHSTSPQLGQGANMALLDAWALSRAVRARRDMADILAHAVRLRRRHVRLYQAISRLFTPVYQSDSRVLPFVRDTLVGPMSKLWPATVVQAAMVSGLVGDPLPPLGLEG